MKTPFIPLSGVGAGGVEPKMDQVVNISALTGQTPSPFAHASVHSLGQFTRPNLP